MSDRSAWTQNRNKQQNSLSTALGEYVPPQSIEAEQSTLGAMLIERNAIESACEIVDQGDFYRETHQTLFDVIVTLHKKGRAVDLITVQEELKNRDKLDSIGGIAYLTSLFETVPTAANVEYYAKIVKEKSVLRNLVSAGLEIIGMARGEVDDIGKTVEDAHRAVLSVESSRHVGREPQTMREIMAVVFDEMERAAEGDGGHLVGMPTGWEELDALTGGYQPDDYIIICGDRGSGKTWTALWTLEHCAFSVGKGVYHVSQEMRGVRVGRRALATVSGVPSQVFRTGRMSARDWEKVNSAGSELYTDLWTVDDRSQLKPSQIRQGVVNFQRRLHREGKELGMVVVDYLQLCAPDEKYTLKHQQISSISAGLRQLAADLLVPVIALSQLTRSELRSRENKRPRASDLAESGDIQSDASMILAPYREQFYSRQEAPEMFDGERKIREDEVEMLILKSRDGDDGQFFKSKFTPALGRYMPIRKDDF